MISNINAFFTIALQTYLNISVGLWIFDLGVSQMTQETVQENERGKFSAFQQCLNSIFDLIYLVLVIILPFADTYAWLGFVSYSSIIGGNTCPQVSALSYAIWINVKNGTFLNGRKSFRSHPKIWCLNFKSQNMNCSSPTNDL